MLRLAALESTNPDTERCRLLAWVASVRHYEEFSEWLAGNLSTNSALWADFATYTATNLVGRKPYYMGSYSGCWGFSFHHMVFQYKECVEELRRRGAAALLQEDMDSVHSISNILHSMGQPFVAPTIEETASSIEMVPMEVPTNRIPDIEVLILE